MDWQWGDAASWLAAVGTIAAVGVALWLALKEGRRRSQDERSQQAELITAWVAAETPEVPWVHVMVTNASHQVAYRLVVSLGDASRDGLRPPDNPEQWRSFVSQLPPGETPVDVDWTGGAGMNARPGVEIAFQDATGRPWIREMNGNLVEVGETDHLERLGLHEPLPWDWET